MSEWLIDNNVILLKNAAAITLWLALCSLFLGLFLAFLFAGIESFRIKLVAKLGTLMVTLFRGLPEILVVLAIYNGIPMVLGLIADGFTVNLIITTVTIRYPIENFDVSPILCGIIALSLLYAAYASQTLRGAFNAIPIAQWQAGEVLGLTRLRILLRLIIPQIWAHALPGLGNQWLVLLKDTALVSLITVNDVMLQTRSIIAYTHRPFSAYLIAAGIYLLISILSQLIIKTLAKRSNYFRQEVNHD